MWARNTNEAMSVIASGHSKDHENVGSHLSCLATHKTSLMLSVSLFGAHLSIAFVHDIMARVCLCVTRVHSREDQLLCSVPLVCCAASIVFLPVTHPLTLINIFL